MMMDRRLSITIAILVAAAILVPILSLATPADSAMHMPPYVVALVGKYLCYAILAVALDLVWGYCGILSLGHGAFFALGGYAMGMYLMRQIGTRGVYADPILPDFMVFLNWKELPLPWWGFNYFPYASLMVLLVPGVLAFVFGWFAFRSRVTGVYLSIITQAMTFALKLAFFRNDMGFGGNNGMTDFKDILGFNVQADATRAALFSLTAVSLAVTILVSAFIVNSKFGKVLVAIRDAESRTRFVGYRVENYKLLVFTISAMMAGVAGALYTPQVGIINPSEFEPTNSIEAVIWVAVGGRGTLVGAAFGAILVNFAKTYFTGVLPEYWLFALGLLFILVTIFLPKGILGLQKADWLNFQKLLLSADGRINRKSYWIGALSLFAVELILALLMATHERFTVTYDVLGLLLLVLIYPSLCIAIKRFHDRGKSGWWVLIGLIPVVGGIWCLVELGFLPGARGSNQYGPDTLHGSKRQHDAKSGAGPVLVSGPLQPRAPHEEGA
jgi:urea transport system permease protein